MSEDETREFNKNSHSVMLGQIQTSLDFIKDELHDFRVEQSRQREKIESLEKRIWIVAALFIIGDLAFHGGTFFPKVIKFLGIV